MNRRTFFKTNSKAALVAAITPGLVIAAMHPRPPLAMPTVEAYQITMRIDPETGKWEIVPDSKKPTIEPV